MGRHSGTRGQQYIPIFKGDNKIGWYKVCGYGREPECTLCNTRTKEYNLDVLCQLCDAIFMRDKNGYRSRGYKRKEKLV